LGSDGRHYCQDRRQQGSIGCFRAPWTRQSGKWRCRSFIGGGRKTVRNALFMAAMVAARYIKTKVVKFPRKRCEQLLTQLLGFDAEKHDDAVDALVYLILGVIGDGDMRAKGALRLVHTKSFSLDQYNP
jgi:hypothetical protein